MYRRLMTGLSVVVILAVAAIAVGGAAADEHNGKRHDRHNVKRHGGEKKQAKDSTPSAGATLEVRKILVPASDSGRFNLLVRKTGGELIKQASNVGDGGSTGRFAAPSGQLLTVEETAVGSTKLSDYTTTVECHSGTGPIGSIVASSSRTGVTLTLNPQTDYTCSFTNTRKASTTTTGSTSTSTTTTTDSSAGATLEVRKILAPATDPGRFNLITRYLRGALINKTSTVGNGGTSGRFSIPSGRTLNIEETARPGTTLTSYTSKVDCKVSGGPDNGKTLPTQVGHAIQLVAQPGDDYTCTFTNTRTSS
jgi:hypothetical protein